MWHEASTFAKFMSSQRCGGDMEGANICICVKGGGTKQLPRAAALLGSARAAWLERLREGGKSSAHEQLPAQEGW